MSRRVVIDANRIFSERIAGELWTSDRELEAGLRRKAFDHFFTPP